MADRRLRTIELLESLTAGERMSQYELDELVKKSTPEDLFLEYKHGKLLEKREAAQTLRKYLSGFANSAGGILIIGVDEATWTVTGCQVSGGQDLAEWASRSLTPIASYFSPLPRFEVVEHPDGNVLVASTDRSLGLVPCVEAGQLIYYLRLHDQTLKAPEYLISDLLLGRRQHPYLHITDFSLAALETRQERETGVYSLHFAPSFVCENGSLFRSDYVRFGIVSWSKDPIARTDLSKYLLSYIEVHNMESGSYSGPRCLVHFEKTFPGIGPFDIRIFDGIATHLVPLRTHSDWHIPYTWKAAAYLLSDGAPPIWYQLDMEVNMELVSSTVKGGASSVRTHLQFKRMSGERPVVAWDGI